ncbi:MULTISPECIES: hypothetical protein [Microbacterium]|uniref:DUF7882 family protein n=1 Tax=Microbacterium TaxID=33882 RepID=UPI002787DB6C|nr:MULTISPECIES: hypothetical protein [Microbacterium]MDQ1082964.1 hypothetical protein [Microbacterium sp. SORGH_AS_0344]MDQ1168267.1 hypothetical protein [Microbacterium proteolyticum]
MGSLFYGSSPSPIDIPDRLLAHVKVVIATKLRRGESFTMSWRHPMGEQSGRSTIWIQPSIPLRFVFGAAEPETLDNALLQTYANAANSSSGLTIDLDPHDSPAPQRADAR